MRAERKILMKSPKAISTASQSLSVRRPPSFDFRPLTVSFFAQQDLDKKRKIILSCHLYVKYGKVRSRDDDDVADETIFPFLYIYIYRSTWTQHRNTNKYGVDRSAQ